MSIKLFCCGDFVNFTSNDQCLSEEIINIIHGCDFSIANFEAPVFTNEVNRISKAGPYVHQSKESPKILKNIGFTHVSLANNHIYDYGEVGFKSTVNALQLEGIKYIGAGFSFDEGYQGKILSKDGFNIGLLAACENEFGCNFDESLTRSGYAWLFHPRLEDEIISLRKKVDKIVLVAHAGVEDIPIPIKEWRDRYKRLCDLGVDIVVGHHPHVPQGYEEYKGSLIFYSLGNFYFDTPAFLDKDDDSYSVILSFEKNKEVDFDILYHKKIKGKTTRVESCDVNFSLSDLNKKLEKGYYNLNDEIAVELYEKYYKSYYCIALDGNLSFLSLLKKMIKKIVGMHKGNDKDKALLLLHNIRIDSHRFTVQRALRLKYEK